MPAKNAGTNKLPFSKILSSVMKERSLTLRNVAAMADVSISVVQNWVSGANPHDLRSIARLAKALGMSFESLLLGTNDEVGQIRSLSEIFDEVQVFDGYCRVNIKKLVARR